MVKKVYEVVVVTNFLKDEMSGGARFADSPIQTLHLTKESFQNKNTSVQIRLGELTTQNYKYNGPFFILNGCYLST